MDGYIRLRLRSKSATLSGVPKCIAPMLIVLYWALSGIHAFGAILVDSKPPLGTHEGGRLVASTRQFEHEVKAADSVESRDERVEHLLKAVALRPDDPDNIRLEFRVGILLSQNSDRAHQQPVRPLAALPVFEGIVARYDHKGFYRSEPAKSTDDPQDMVPRSAILAGSILAGASKDGEKARKYLVQAMDDLRWTYEKRMSEWSATPHPERTPFQDDREFAAVVKRWEQRKLDATAGNVLGSQELAIVSAAVRQYGLSFGPQSPESVPGIMRDIIRDYPGTPMARAAQQHGERAIKRVLSKTVDRLPGNLVNMPPAARKPVETNPSATATARNSLLPSPVASANPAGNGHTNVVHYFEVALAILALGAALLFIVRRQKRMIKAGK